jgi:hypothetical protein
MANKIIPTSQLARYIREDASNLKTEDVIMRCVLGDYSTHQGAVIDEYELWNYD